MAKNKKYIQTQSIKDTLNWKPEYWNKTNFGGDRGGKKISINEKKNVRLWEED